jgi:hypothetical protein
LRAKREVVRAKLEELEEGGGNKWQTVRSGVEKAYDELELAFKKL